jgi:hypothetical protein
MIRESASVCRGVGAETSSMLGTWWYSWRCRRVDHVAGYRGGGVGPVR